MKKRKSLLVVSLATILLGVVIALISDLLTSIVAAGILALFLCCPYLKRNRKKARKEYFQLPNGKIIYPAEPDKKTELFC